MERGQSSKTAAAAAAVRAEHYQFAADPIFSDPFALQFTDQHWRRILQNPPLKWLVFAVLMRSLAPIAGQVIARSRYAEDALEQTRSKGIGQYVIVGAGFDSFALRRTELESTLRIFELDHPDTQLAKIQRIEALDRKLPNNLEFVAVDFERESVADGLQRSAYQQQLPAFFSWLGTTPYLSNAATLSTLASIVQICAPGSEIVFDYLVPDHCLSKAERRVVEKLKRFTARRGEPLIGEFDPAEMEQVLSSVGLELVDNLSGAEQEQRYFAHRTDGFRPWAASFLAHARVPL